MKACLVAAGLATAFNAAAATEYGNVLSSAPVTAQVAVPQTVCSDEPQPVAPATSGAGALFGAVLGGLLGSAVGGGSGQAVATGLGVVAGAMAGDRNEAFHAPPALATVRRCRTATVYENRLLGYDVVYEYRGQRHSARLDRDPGSQIALNVSVAPAGAVTDLPPPLYAQPQAAAAGPLYPAPPPYAYYGYGVPALTVVPSLFIGGHWHRGGGHRRHR